MGPRSTDSCVPRGMGSLVLKRQMSSSAAPAAELSLLFQQVRPRGSLHSVALGRRPRGKPQGLSLPRVSRAFHCIMFVAQPAVGRGRGAARGCTRSGALPSCPPCILMAEMEAKIKTSDLHLLPGDPLSQEAHRPRGGHFPSLRPPAPVGTTRPVSQEEGPPPVPSGRTWPVGPGWPWAAREGPFLVFVAWREEDYPQELPVSRVLKEKEGKAGRRPPRGLGGEREARRSGTGRRRILGVCPSTSPRGAAASIGLAGQALLPGFRPFMLSGHGSGRPSRPRLPFEENVSSPVSCHC